MQQDTFPKGKIGFWTKSDSVTYFTDTKIVYTPRAPPAQGIVRDVIKKYPRLLGLEIYVQSEDPAKPRLLASKDPKQLGHSGGKAEQDVIKRSVIYYGKEKGGVAVTMPLRDRNGDTIAAARVVMHTFPGQTQDNAVARALPIVKDIEAQITSLQELLQ